MDNYIDKVLHSESLDPYYNLAYEDFLLRNPENFSKKILFIWQSRPSIVLGRFQNPWLEIDLKLAQRDNVLICRRQSGGGTVYHDEGNLNFCFIGKTSKEENFSWFIAQMKSLGVDIDVNERNDLIFKNKKISGSAFKNTKDNSFHHFTFLVQSNLDKLTQYLHHDQINITSKSVKSIRSKVVNLNVLSVAELKAHFASSEQLKDNITLSSYEKFKSKKWIFGETPKYTFKSSDGIVKQVAKGKSPFE